MHVTYVRMHEVCTYVRLYMSMMSMLPGLRSFLTPQVAVPYTIVIPADLPSQLLPLSCGWDMLRCEESSDGFQSLATLQLKSWFPVGCWNIGGGYLSVQPQPVWHAATQRFTVEDFNRFSLLPSRLGFVHQTKMGVKNSGWIASQVTHGVVALVYINPKNGKWLSNFFWVKKNISSCQVVTSWASCEYFAVSPAGWGASERRLRWEGNFTSAAAGLRSQHSALITQVNISGDGESGRYFTWSKWKKIKDFPPPRKKKGRKQHTI